MPNSHATQFRRRLRVSALSLTIAVAVLGTSGYLNAARSQTDLAQVSHSHRQLGAARQITLEARHWTLQLRYLGAVAGSGTERAALTKEIAATRQALDAALADFADATRDYIQTNDDNDDDEAEESERIGELERTLAELGTISDQTIAGQPWTAETRERVAALSLDLDGQTSAIETDELGEVEEAKTQAHAAARRATAMAAFIFGLALIATLVVMIGLSRRLRDAIGNILEAASSVARGDLSARATIDGEDEFAELGRNFNTMVAELGTSLEAREEAAAQARVLAREAGIAQITTGVLHNIGNALNGVNISLELVTDSGIDSRLTRLAKVGHMLGEHEHDLAQFLSQDPRGSKLPRYLAVLAPELEHDAATFGEELARLRERVDHVIRILRTYQEHGITRIDDELVELDRLAKFAVDVAISGERQRQYAIIHDIASGGEVTLDKHRTLEILINLVRNGADALDEAVQGGLDDPRLELSITRDLDERLIRFIIRDNGIGVAAEDLERIFAHGYSTKGANGSGFGLHASANAAVEMGGRLEATSDGPGTGASFILEMPLLVDTETGGQSTS